MAEENFWTYQLATAAKAEIKSNFMLLIESSPIECWKKMSVLAIYSEIWAVSLRI